MTAAEEQAAKRRFDQTESFWAKRYPHLVGVTATRLAILRTGKTLNCSSIRGAGDYIDATDPSRTEYCQHLGLVILTEGLADFINQTVPNTETADAALEFFVGHEFGHAIQAAKGELKLGVPTTVDQELQADCYAGEAFGALDPRHVKYVKSFLASLPEGDARHGTPRQRADSFEAGVTSDSC